MKPSHKPGVLASLSLIVLVAICISCGGGGAGGGTITIPPPPTGGGGQGLSIATTSLPEGWSEEPYSATLQATGGKPPYTWSVGPPVVPNSFSTLHKGLSLSSSGAISGIPLESGTSGPNFVVQDSAGNSASKVVTITIHLNVAFSIVPLPDGIVGRLYSESIQIWGGQGPFTFAITANSEPVPAGMNVLFSQDFGYTHVTITGVPVKIGTTRLEFTVRDETRLHTSTQFYNFRTVNPLAMTPASLPAAGVGIPYSVNLSVSGGVPPYAWGTANGISSPPLGLTFDPAGILSGTPTSAGSYVTFLSVKDSGLPPQTAYAGSGLWVVDRLTITKPQPKWGVVGKTYSGDTMEAAGGTAPYSWTNVPQQYPTSNLPPGISLAADGSLSGTPSTSGTYFPVIEVRDSSSPPNVATSTPLLVVQPPLSVGTTTLNDGIDTLGYYQDIQFTGGLPPYTSRVSSGSLPPGLIYIPTLYYPSNYPARITGSHASLGVFSFTLEVTDSSSPPDVISQPFTIRVNSQLVFNPPASLPDGLQGSPYSYTFTASGGVPPYVWDTQNYPTGLSMNPTSGTFSGTPAQPWQLSAAIRVSDSSVPPQSFQRYIPFKVIERLRTSTSLPPLRVGAAARLQLGASGGTPPVRWTLLTGNLPSGLTFSSSTGEITGTPAAVESQTFTVRLDDSGTSFPQSIQQSLTLTTVATQGRNDSIATATPLSNGTYYASISPMDDGAGGTSPDSDYFAITANPGNVVGVVIRAELLSPPSPMDSVIEIVDSNGQRLGGCDFDRNANSFTSFCMSDDDYSRNTLDSALYYRVPGTPGSSSPLVTLFVHVLDWSGMARPDFRYSITITGAN